MFVVILRSEVVVRACLLLAALFASGLPVRAAASDPSPAPVVYGPPPAFVISPDYYGEELIDEHIHHLDSREQELVQAGRPANYRLKRGLSISAVILGGAVFGFALLPSLLLTNSEQYALFYGLLAGGGAVALAGTAGLIVLKRRTLYRYEIDALRAERSHWQRELKRLRQLRYGQLVRPDALELSFGPGGLALRGSF
jgi:hypothetical protein